MDRENWDEAMGRGIQLKIPRHDAAETFSPWTSLGGMFREVDARYKAEIEAICTGIWLVDRIH